MEGNAEAKGYYLVDYKGSLLSALTGSASAGLGAAERVDLIGEVQMLAAGGKLPALDALNLVQSFHDDSERLVVQRALDVALSVRQDLVPAESDAELPALHPEEFSSPRARIGMDSEARRDR